MSDPRIEQMLDRLDIQEMRNRYCAFVDAHQWREAANLFTEDGVFQGLEVARGRAEILDWFSRSVPQTFSGAWHMCTNATTYLQGDNATGTTAFTFYCVENDVAKVGLGHYKDNMVKTSGGWRFSKRQVQFDRFFDWKDGFGAPLTQTEQIT